MTCDKALADALSHMALLPEDAAIVELAHVLAKAIDESPDQLHQFGRSYRETLVELGMTPKVRALLTKDAGPKKPEASPIDELRSRREKRAAK